MEGGANHASSAGVTLVKAELHGASTAPFEGPPAASPHVSPLPDHAPASFDSYHIPLMSHVPVTAVPQQAQLQRNVSVDGLRLGAIWPQISPAPADSFGSRELTAVLDELFGPANGSAGVIKAFDLRGASIGFGAPGQTQFPALQRSGSLLGASLGAATGGLNGGAQNAVKRRPSDGSTASVTDRYFSPQHGFLPSVDETGNSSD